MNEKHATITRILHWGFAAFVLVMLGLGIYMKNTEFSLTVYEWHKSLGVIFSMLIGIRLYWRIKNPWQSSAVGQKYEGLVFGMHTLLLSLLIMVPLMGMINSAFSGYSLHLFDYIIVPKNFDAAGNIVAFNESIYKTAVYIHKLLAYTLTGLILLHVSAALKHHFINKDMTLTKMLKK